MNKIVNESVKIRKNALFYQIITIIMKKLLGLLTLVIGMASSLTFASTSDCKEVNFNGWSVCISVEKLSSTRYQLHTDVIQGSSSSLQCGILLLDQSYQNIGCDGQFYNSKDEGLIKIFIRKDGYMPIDWDGKPSSDDIWTFPQWMFDFDNGEWTDTNYYEDDSYTSNGDLDNFYVYSSPSSPARNQYVDLTVRARDEDDNTIENYRWTIDFKVTRKSGSSRINASSSYYEINEDYEDWYDFTSNDDGTKVFYDLIKFKLSGDYKLTITDEDDNIEEERTYYIWTSTSSSSSNGDIDNFSLTSSPSTLARNERADLTINARDVSNNTLTDYDGTVKIKVQKKSWSYRSDASSIYYELDRTSYNFTSYDDGEVELNNLIRFTQNWDYRVTVYDEDDETIYGDKTYYISSSSSSSSSNTDIDNLYIVTSPSGPNRNDRTSITIRARDDNNNIVEDYDGTVRLKIQKQVGSSRSDSYSSYYELDRTSYNFSIDDDGEETFTNIMRFTQNGNYKLTVYDQDDSSIYGVKYFNISSTSSTSSYSSSISSSSNSDVDNFYLLTSPSAPDRNDRTSVTVRARDNDNNTVDNYDGTIRIKVQKKSGSIRSDWYSSYYELDRTSYTFASNDDWEKLFSDLVRFNQDGDYKLTIYDQDDSTILGVKYFYIQNSNSTSSTSSSSTSSSTSSTKLTTFQADITPSAPEKNERVDLTLQAQNSYDEIIDSYYGKVTFSVQRKSNLTRVSATSSYYQLSRSSYTFTTSDDGEKIFSDFIKFTQNGEFRIVIKDTSKNITKYLNVSVDTSSNTYGFTANQFNLLKSTYQTRYTYVNQIKNSSSNLRNDETYLDMADEIYNNMKDVINNVANREYETYEDFGSAIARFYSYVIDNK